MSGNRQSPIGSGGGGGGGAGGGPPNRSSTANTKFSLHPYKPVATVDQARAVEIWLKLQHAIGKIYKQEASQLSFEELYRCVIGVEWGRGGGEGEQRDGIPKRRE